MKPNTTAEISSTLKCTSEVLKSRCECQCHIKTIIFILHINMFAVQCYHYSTLQHKRKPNCNYGLTLQGSDNGT
jgi:hypothetical protein